MSIDRRQKILTMMKMQDSINCQINPEWVSVEQDWYRAVWIECAELMDHYGGWKWWKKDYPDMDQVLLEIVDIWHFGLSALLASDSEWERTATNVDNEWEKEKAMEGFHISVELLAEFALQKKEFSITHFSSVVRACEFEFDDLYRSYLGKNILNKFRQDNGYKTGSYIKTWDGKEDNEVLADILKNLSGENDNFEEVLYANLESRYPTPRI